VLHGVGVALGANHRSPSNSTSGSVMGRLVSRPSIVIVARNPERSPVISSATLRAWSSIVRFPCPRPAG
jgi:hypothetical protein